MFGWVGLTALVSAAGGVALAGELATIEQPVCDLPTTLSVVERTTKAGERAFSSLDPEALERSQAQAMLELGCLGESMRPEVAAGLHRLTGLTAFTRGDDQAVALEFQAARLLVPQYTLDHLVQNPEHRLLVAYSAAADAPHGPIERPAPPKGYSASVGGLVGAPRVQGLPAILQLSTEGGEIVQTVYLGPDQALPLWVPPKPPPPAHRRPLLLSTAGSAIAAAGLYTGAAVLNGHYYDNSTDPSDLAGLRQRTNALTISSMSAAGLALALGGTTLITW